MVPLAWIVAATCEFKVPLYNTLLFSENCFCHTDAKADAVLTLPGFLPSVDRPVSANVLGVDASGRTTLELVPGVPTGTFTNEAEYDGLCYTLKQYMNGAYYRHCEVTMVVGPVDMAYSFTDTYFGVGGSQYCSVSGTLAFCTAVIGTSTAAAVMPASGINIQGLQPPAAPVIVRRSGSSEIPLSEPTQKVNGGITISSSIEAVLLSAAVLLGGVVW